MNVKSTPVTTHAGDYLVQGCLDGLNKEQKTFAKAQIARFENMGIAIPYGMIKRSALSSGGTLRIGACNGFYVESNFNVPVKKIDKKSLIFTINRSANYLPICYLGIITGIEIGFAIKEGEDFGDVSIQITAKLIANDKYLKPNTSGFSFEVIQEYEMKTATVVEAIKAV